MHSGKPHFPACILRFGPFETRDRVVCKIRISAQQARIPLWILYLFLIDTEGRLAATHVNDQRFRSPRHPYNSPQFVHNAVWAELPVSGVWGNLELSL